MNYSEKIIGDFVCHDVAGIMDCFKNGVNPNAIHNDKPLVLELINMYLRSPNFSKCFKAFVDHGLVFEDKNLAPFLPFSRRMVAIFLKFRKANAKM